MTVQTHSIVGCLRVRDHLLGSIDPFGWNKPKIGPVLPFASCYHRVPCEQPSFYVILARTEENSCASCDTPIIWHRPPTIVEEVSQIMSHATTICDRFLQANLFPLQSLHHFN
jgi:hypothetical protein